MGIIRQAMSDPKIVAKCEAIARMISSNCIMAEDISQEVFCAMLETENIVDSEIKLEEDFYNLFRRLAWNTYRRMLRVINREQLVADLPLSVTEPEEEINDILDQLQEKESKLVLMRFEGYTYKEIAESMSICVMTVYTMKKHIQQQIGGTI